MKQVVLEKYHCMGNDYLVFDPNKNDLELNAENIKKMCSREARRQSFISTRMRPV